MQWSIGDKEIQPVGKASLLTKQPTARCKMVALDTIRTSNSQIGPALPTGLVAVIVGATNGVGETTVKEFAKHATAPRAYTIGRSQEAGDRITAECNQSNPEGTFTFMQTDASLMRNADAVCAEIGRKETATNLLFLTVGTLQRGSGMQVQSPRSPMANSREATQEGLHYPATLTIYARNRYIQKLLPLLKRATSLRRVVTVYCATFEGQIDLDHFQGWNFGLIKTQGHTASITTLALEGHQQAFPEVSYVHNFPGAVELGIGRGDIGYLMRFLKTVFALLGPLVHIPLEEAGLRHLFLCTSARF